MSILDVTEDKIFETLGKGRDPNFKQIEKVRPIVVKPKKTYTSNQTIRTTQPVKIVQPVVAQVQPVVEPVKIAPVPQVDENVQKLTVELGQLNDRMDHLQKMVKWYVLPQFVVVLVLLLVLLAR